jgi:hypothetical protein
MHASRTSFIPSDPSSASHPDISMILSINTSLFGSSHPLPLPPAPHSPRDPREVPKRALAVSGAMRQKLQWAGHIPCSSTLARGTKSARARRSSSGTNASQISRAKVSLHPDRAILPISEFTPQRLASLLPDFHGLGVIASHGHNLHCRISLDFQFHSPRAISSLPHIPH